jgi:hypothetical protein
MSAPLKYKTPFTIVTAVCSECKIPMRIAQHRWEHITSQHFEMCGWVRVNNKWVCADCYAGLKGEEE